MVLLLWVFVRHLYQNNQFVCIEKNVLAKCKKNFETTTAGEYFLSNWTNVIKSPDGVSFESSWEIFEDQYKEKDCC